MNLPDARKGWHGYKFIYGEGTVIKFASNTDVDERDILPCDGTCTKETCGCGCYRSMVDVDKLDQQ